MKESMKAESTALDGQREKIYHDEGEQTQTLNFLPGFWLQFVLFSAFFFFFFLEQTHKTELVNICILKYLGLVFN